VADTQKNKFFFFFTNYFLGRNKLTIRPRGRCWWWWSWWR